MDTHLALSSTWMEPLWIDLRRRDTRTVSWGTPGTGAGIYPYIPKALTRWQNPPKTPFDLRFYASTYFVNNASTVNWIPVDEIRWRNSVGVLMFSPLTKYWSKTPSLNLCLGVSSTPQVLIRKNLISACLPAFAPKNLDREQSPKPDVRQARGIAVLVSS